MARQSHGRLHFGRKNAPQTRNRPAAEGAEREGDRGKSWAKKWRERFRHCALSAWHENAIVATVCNLFKASAETARAVRAAVGTEIVGAGYTGRRLRLEGLEERCVLNNNYFSLASGTFSQDWSNTALITTPDNNWANVPSIIGYADNVGSTTGISPQNAARLAPQTTPTVSADQNNPSSATGSIADFQPVLVDSFNYADQAAFQAAWPLVSPSASGTLSDGAVNYATTAQQNSRSFTALPTPSATSHVVFSFDFLDSDSTVNPYAQFSEIINTAARTSSGGSVSMGLFTTFTKAQDGGNYYMARILGYTPTYQPSTDGSANPAPAPGLWFKLNDAGAPLRSNGMHNLRVELTGPSTSYTVRYYVDNILAKTLTGVSVTSRQYDAVRIGSGAASAKASAFDNVVVGTSVGVGTNPTVGLRPINAAGAPNLVLHLDATGRQNVNISYNLRDLDASTSDIPQWFGLQYRIGDTGDFTDVPAAFVADATVSGLAVPPKVTAVSATLPAAVNNQAKVQVRILTSNQPSTDEWVGVDDISVTSNPITTTYVDDDWAGFSTGQVIADADPTTPGNQPASIGADAFATITAGLNAAPATIGTTLVNAGAYNEMPLVDNGKTLRIVGAANLGANDITVSGGTLLVDSSLSSGNIAINSGGKLNGAGSITSTGVLVNGGGVMQMDAAATVSSSVTLNSTGTLKGKGTITGSVSTSSATSVIAPGASPGVLSIGGDLVTNGNLQFEVNSPYATAGTDYDQINVTGGVNVNGATIAITGVGGAPVSNKHLTLIDSGNGSTTPRTGANLQEGALVNLNGRDWMLSYNDSGAEIGDVTLSYTDDFDVTAPVDSDTATADAVNEGAPQGTYAGITASAIDADTTNNVVTYSLVNNDGNRFQIDPTSGAVSTGSMAIDRETDGASRSITIRATSADGSTADTVFSIAIGGINDNSPLGSADANDVTEDTALTATGNVLTNDTDADLPPETLSVGSGVGTGIAGSYGSLDLAANGSYTYTLNNSLAAVQALITGGGTLTEVFNYQVSDGTNLSPSTTLTITIHGKDDAALIGGDDTASVTEDLSLSDSGALTLSDADAGQSTFQSDGALTTHGSYTIDSAGNWIYSLNNADAAVQALGAGGILSDSFTALSFDGISHLVTITITGANDVAVIGGHLSADVSEDGTLVDNGALTISDVDSAESAFQPASASTAYGSYTLDAAGAWTYTLNNANPAVQVLNTGQTLNDSFTAVAVDGTSQVVSVTISGLDEPPGVFILNGDNTSNSLMIDLDAMTYKLDGGTPQSLVNITDFTFNGGDGSDSITIIGGTFGTVAYSYTNANDGAIDLGNGLVLHYTGLDPVSNSGTVNNAIFNLPATGDNASLVINSPGMLTLSSSPATFESTTFAMPSNGLTVNANNGDDTLSVQPSNGYTVIVNGGSQTTADTLNVDAVGAYAINTGSEIRVQGFANIAYAGFEVVHLINPGVLTTLYVDDSWTGTTPGADPDGLGAAINFGVDSFATIQDAINAAGSSVTTILVHGGLYHEALTIGKTLSFNQLDGAGSVDVDASQTLAPNGVDIVPTTTTPINVSFNGFDFSGASSNGIHVGKNGTALANLILSNCTITGALTGVWVDGGSGKFQGNTLTGNNVGIRVENEAVVDAGGGIYASTGGNVLTGYTGTGGNYAIENLNAAPGQDVYAEFNNFGSYVNISTIENYVYDDTDNPLRTMVNFSGAVNAQPAPSVVYVDDTWAGTPLGTDADGAGNVVPNWTGIGGNADGSQFGVDEFATIQDAINAVASGGQIYVYDGTYAQPLAVDKAVSMFGFQAGIDARTRNATESVIKAGAAIPALIEVGAAGVTIDGFTVDGNNQATRAIRVNEVDNAIVKNNVIMSAVRGLQYDGRVVGGNTGGLVEQNLIQNLTADVDGSYGVLAFDSSYASVTSNRMTGLDVGIFEQSFYYANGNLNPANVISGNDITAADLGYGTNERSAAAATTALSGNIYHIAAGGTGIQLNNIYKTDGVSLTNETILGVRTGVYAYLNGGSVAIANSSITGDGLAGSIGIQTTNFLADYASYATAFSNTASSLTISGSNISNAATGVLVEDANADWSGDVDSIDDATGAVSITIDSDTNIFNTGTGVRLTGPAANALITGNDNSIHDNTVGVDVDGGAATITGNHFYANTTGIQLHNGGTASIVGNNLSSSMVSVDVDNGAALLQGNTFASSIGVRIQNGGIADLGQNGPGINYTGLGVSTGGNTFSSYSATATTTSGAIVNLNTGGAYLNAGAQGYAGAAKDVAAFNNVWNSPSVTGIENVIWHDADNTDLGFVDYVLVPNLVVSLVPLPTVATNQNVMESQVGGTATVYGQFTNYIQAHKVTVSWGDGSPDTVVNLNAGVFTFAITSPAGTYTDDPNGSVQTINRSISVKVEEVANPANFLTDGSLSVNVNNVSPTASLSTTDSDLDEGETLTLDIGAVVDPGSDTVMAYRINWGDGTNDVITNNLAAGDTQSHPYQDGLANPARTVTLDIFDEDGTWNTVASLTISVHNINPTAGGLFSFDPSVNEGTSTTVFFVGPFMDPGNPDGPFHYAYDFNGNGTYGEPGESGDGTYTGSVTSATATVPPSFLADGPGSRTVNARIIDNDGGFSQYSVVIGIDNVTPVVDAGADTTVFPNSVLNHVVDISDTGSDAPWTVRINWNNAPGFDETFNVPSHSFNINNFSTWMYTNANIGNTYNVQVQVDDNDGGVASDNFNVTVLEDTLRVTNFVTNNSGFDITLSRAPNLTDLNLYDGRLDGSPTILDAVDVTLIRNGSQNIRGSIVWAPDTNTLSFVATGGVLAEGNYGVTLFSSATAFHDGVNLLDGDDDFNDNEIGDNYTTSFVVGVAAPGTRVVSLPDFARGPGQAIGVPGTGSILPIKIDSAVGVDAVDVDVLYNPQLMTITAASLGTGPVSAGGWSITQNSINIDATHRLLKLTVSGPISLSGSNVELIRLTSSVPGTATYESSQVIRLQNLRVNEDLIASKADNAIHKVVYVGDADGDGAYGGTDAGLISRVVVNLDSGFDAHDWTDPQIVGDASGDGTLSGLDASYVAKEAVLINVPEVPALPSVSLMFNTSGVDPQYTIDDNIHAAPGGSVTVPVQLTVLQPGDVPPGVVGSTFDLFFDPSLLTYQSATNGSFWTAADGWTIFANPNVQPGRVIVSMYNSQGHTSSAGQGPIANITFGVSNSAPVGGTSTLDVGAKNPHEGNLTWSDNDGSLLFANLVADYNRNGVVESGDYVLFRKTLGNSVPNFTGADGSGNGIVDQGDYDVWRANFGNVPSPGAGAGMSLANDSAIRPVLAAGAVTTALAANEIVVKQPAAQRQSASAISEPASSSAVSFASVEAAASIVASRLATSASSYESARNRIVPNLADQAYLEALVPSHHSRTAALTGQGSEFSLRLADANLIDLAHAPPKRLVNDGDRSLWDDADPTEAVDELFAEMDDDALAVRLGI